MLNILRSSSLRLLRAPSFLQRSLATGSGYIHETATTAAQAASVSPQYRRPGPIDLHSHSLKPRKDVYQLPVNNEEVARLNNQHVLLKMLIGGNYTMPVKEYLAYQPGQKKTIFDLGCGTGAWAMDMASDFPHCSVIGADVAPMDIGLAPPNLRIDVCDANKGLQMYRNQFDLVNGRLVAMGIKNYSSLIGELFATLKPGGFLQLQEWDFFVVDAQKQIIDTDHWFGRWCAALRHSLAVRNASVNAAEGLDTMVKAHGFDSVHQKDVWMPVGPSFPTDTAEGRHLNYVGEFMRENVKAFIKGGKTLILGSGMDMEEYKTLEFNATMEVHNASTPMFLRLNCITARKQ